MRISSLLAALVLVGVAAAGDRATDLTKIDRTIAKEPAYKSKPRYCLLVFGAEAKTRVWLVLDGDTLYADRNGNGDLTEKGERFVGARAQGLVIWEVGDVAAPDGKVTYTGLKVYDISEAGSRGLEVGPGLGISVDVPIRGARMPQSMLAGSLISYHKYRLHFADQPKDAPVIQFGGPLVMMLMKPKRLIGGVLNDLEARVGTPGLGKDTAAVINDDRQLLLDSVGRNTAAVAELEFTDGQGRNQRVRAKLTYD